MRNGLEHVINIVGPSGSGKTTFIQNVFGSNWSVFRPSDILRQNADRFGVTITKPQDYLTIHQALADEDPDFMVRPILALKGLVALDGLRVFAHASRLKGVLGDSYHTTALSCPDDLRLRRLQSRANRPESIPETIPEMHVLDATSIPSRFQFDKVLAMADLPPQPIDTSGNPMEVAARYGLLVRAAIQRA